MREILFNCKYVFTNSKNQKDAEKFLVISCKNLYYTYAPCIDEELIDENNENIKSIYNIKSDHFITCNQFWKHKNHDTVLKAFAEYLKNKGQADLVFTGNTRDRKFQIILNIYNL